MNKLTAPQQKFLDEMAKTKSRERSPHHRVANALHKKGLVAFAFPVGWFVTPAGMAYVSYLKGGTNEKANS